MDKSVVVGLSGGVDSSVSALLLKQQGWKVTCVWLDIGLSSGEAAQAAADFLELPLKTVDIRKELEEHVCVPFQQEYLAGRTPLPCARCNLQVKFPALLRAAGQIGAGYAATGHYARSENGLLLRGKPANDQSYMLARLTRDMLQRIVFPLGSYEKAQVRQIAAQFGLPSAATPDSMEICFIPDGDYAAWLERRGATPPPGEFVDTRGRVLGTHQGIHRYTLGQRRGLGIAAGRRLFVADILPEKNQVVLSEGEELYVQQAYCTDLNWIAIDPPAGPIEAGVRLRHSKIETPATLTVTGQGVFLRFHTPARAPTPGQLAVFYDGDIVLGSGWIAREPA